ncbi:undecaprenyl-diphosphate phosphatase [Marinomonas agarivorans]|nr:undecaprenyl-diphosphate phosphatase [Marinomonas agarivorans]
MLWYQIVLLALIQGLTEFLPVSSSAHLILPAQLFNWPDQGLAFDVAVHFGTLIAVVSYFYQDTFSIGKSWCLSVLDPKSEQAKDEKCMLGWYIIIATIPAGLAGYLFMGFIETHLRSVEVIAWMTIVFGILLWIADKFFKASKSINELSKSTSLLIGLSQAVALIPGTSRSGVTMTMALFLGFKREVAARFSFLLSIPLISLAAFYKLGHLITSDVTVDWGAIIVGTALSMISAYVCIYFFLKWLNSIGFTVFLIYRLLLGFFLLGLVYL